MSRSAALLLAFAAVALSVASARLSPDDVSASDALTGRQLLGDKCKEKDGCKWCEDVGGEKEHGEGYECQPATYILGDVTNVVDSILGKRPSNNKWCRAKEPKEPKCEHGWFYSKTKAADCECNYKAPGYCCHEAKPPPPPKCSDKPKDKHTWFQSSEEKSDCYCEPLEGTHDYCCYELPPPPKCTDKPKDKHTWFQSSEEKSDCYCEPLVGTHDYCCYELPPPPKCEDKKDHEWSLSYYPTKDGCKCEPLKGGKNGEYCCYELPKPKTCKQEYGSSYFANEYPTRSGCSCKKAPGHGYCCKKVAPPKPRCVKRWYYGKHRNFCEDSKPDKTKFCIVYKFGGKSVGCCAKKEKNDYDDDRCFFKSVHNKMRKCCYDASRKMKKDKKHHSCISSSYKGKSGNFCYDKNVVY